MYIIYLIYTYVCVHTCMHRYIYVCGSVCVPECVAPCGSNDYLLNRGIKVAFKAIVLERRLLTLQVLVAKPRQRVGSVGEDMCEQVTCWVPYARRGVIHGPV